jgi:hypothetical protein
MRWETFDEARTWRMRQWRLPAAYGRREREDLGRVSKAGRLEHCKNALDNFPTKQMPA